MALASSGSGWLWLALALAFSTPCASWDDLGRLQEPENADGLMQTLVGKLPCSDLESSCWPSWAHLRAQEAPEGL